MMVFPVGIEHSLDVPIKRPHDADTREHRRPAMFCDEEQRFHRGLPFLGIVFRLGQLGDVERGVPERDELATVGHLDWIGKLLIPRQADHGRNSARPLRSRFLAERSSRLQAV